MKEVPGNFSTIGEKTLNTCTSLILTTDLFLIADVNISYIRKELAECVVLHQSRCVEQEV